MRGLGRWPVVLEILALRVVYGSLPVIAVQGQENSHLAQLQSLSSQLGGAKEAVESAGAEGSPAGLAHAIPPGTMPFVPSPETLLLLLRSFASE